MWKKKSGPRSVNYVWALAGGYLVYLGGKLLLSCYRGEANSAVVNLLCGIAFMVIGGLVIVREWHIYRNPPQEDTLPEDVEQIECPKEEIEVKQEDKP